MGANAPGVTELFADVERDGRGVARGLWTRRVVMTLFAALAVLALLDLFGQSTTADVIRGPGAALRVSAPPVIRGGLLFQTRIDVTAPAGLEAPKLVLARGVLENMQVSSIEPAAEAEASRDGKLVLSYGALDPGSRFTVWMQFQVDPSAIGSQDYDISLVDGATTVATVDRDLQVLP